MKIGLTLAGGMAKGALQLGALKAVREYIPLSEISAISCASIGVLNGYAFATDQLENGEKMWRSFCQEDDKFFITQVLRSNGLQNVLADLYETSTDLHCDFYASLVDITHRNIAYKNLTEIDKKFLHDYLKASVAMPVCNPPVQISGTSYYDGAMVDNIPVYPLVDKDLDYTICIYFDEYYYSFENPTFNDKVIKMTFLNKTFIKQSLFFTEDSIDEMIKSGYDRTMYLLNSLFSKGYDDLEYIYKGIKYNNENVENQKIRVTGDVVVTNINKVVQKLVKRKIIV